MGGGGRPRSARGDQHTRRVPDVNIVVVEAQHDLLHLHHDVVYSVCTLAAPAKLAWCSEPLTPCPQLHSYTA